VRGKPGIFVDNDFLNGTTIRIDGAQRFNA
jgi:hypothetical protein